MITDEEQINYVPKIFFENGSAVKLDFLGSFKDAEAVAEHYFVTQKDATGFGAERSMN